MTRSYLVAACCCLLCMLMQGCKKPAAKETLIGKWKQADATQTSTVTFFHDGTVNIQVMNTTESSQITVAYKFLDDTHIQLKSTHIIEVDTITELTGDTVTFEGSTLAGTLTRIP